MDKFIELLNLKQKKDIENFCKDLVITSEEFADFIVAGMAGVLTPYLHWRHHVNLEPEHLWPTQEELDALHNNGVGNIEGKGLKAVKKIGQMFEDRKLLSVHVFYHSSKKYWHMFYFNQRDTAAHGNHWDLGPHIHYTHDTFLNVDLDEVIEQILAPKPKLPKSIHIKYDYHQNREKDA